MREYATCREAVLGAFRDLAAKTGRDAFGPAEIVAHLEAGGTRFKASTIRTHVVSKMCADAPDHHARVYDDLERVGKGSYRLRRGA